METSSTLGSLVRPQDPEIQFLHAVATLCVKHWDIIAVTRYDERAEASRNDSAGRTYLIVPNGRYDSKSVQVASTFKTLD